MELSAWSLWVVCNGGIRLEGPPSGDAPTDVLRCTRGMQWGPCHLGVHLPVCDVYVDTGL